MYSPTHPQIAVFENLLIWNGLFLINGYVTSIRNLQINAITIDTFFSPMPLKKERKKTYASCHRSVSVGNTASLEQE